MEKTEKDKFEEKKPRGVGFKNSIAVLEKEKKTKNNTIKTKTKNFDCNIS